MGVPQISSANKEQKYHEFKKSEYRKSQRCSMCAGWVQRSGRSQLDGCPAEGAGEVGEAPKLLSRRELSLHPADEGVRPLKKHNITKHNITKQNKTKQNKTKQNKTKQNKTKQNKQNK